jgi:putative oxidoreductase
MSAFDKWKSWAPELLSILRIVAALLFISFGTMKMFAIPVGMPPDNSTAVFPTQTWFGGMLELVGGTLLLIGFCTRPVSFVLSGEMAVAYWQFHAQGSMWPVVNGGTPAILYCFVFLYFSAAGPGPWSVDAMRGRR